jgi:hypothetical protein
MFNRYSHTTLVRLLGQRQLVVKGEYVRGTVRKQATNVLLIPTRHDT